MKMIMVTITMVMIIVNDVYRNGDVCNDSKIDCEDGEGNSSDNEAGNDGDSYSNDEDEDGEKDENYTVEMMVRFKLLTKVMVTERWQ